MRLFPALCLLFLITSCTSADQEYCSKFNIAGTPEYGKCVDYFMKQQQWFDTDHAVCAREADKTYPPTLYDNGGFVPATGGMFWAGHYSPGGMVEVEPDYYHNAQVDTLRARIIGPCMQQHGWVSPDSWQAGRQTVSPAKHAPATPAASSAPASTENALPWLKQ